MSPTLYELAQECRHLTAQIPRAVRAKGGPPFDKSMYHIRYKEVLPRMVEILKTIDALSARITAIECALSVGHVLKNKTGDISGNCLGRDGCHATRLCDTKNGKDRKRSETTDKNLV